MKNWHKQKNQDLGTPLLYWRHKTWNKFFNKIGSWLLGAFVYGILTAILFYFLNFFIDLAESTLPMTISRLVFFVVLIFGIIDAFFRHVVFGLKFIVTDEALVRANPVLGYENLNGLLGSPFKNFFLKWDEIKSIDRNENKLTIVQKNDYELELEACPILKLVLDPDSGEPRVKEPTEKGLFAKDEKFDKDSLQIIVQKIKDVKRR